MLAHVDNQEAYYIARILPMKLEMDAWYVCNRSMATDAAIIGVTVWLLYSPYLTAWLNKLGPSSNNQQVSEAREARNAASFARMLDRFLPSYLLSQPAGLLVVRDEQRAA